MRQPAGELLVKEGSGTLTVAKTWCAILAFAAVRCLGEKRAPLTATDQYEVVEYCSRTLSGCAIHELGCINLA